MGELARANCLGEHERRCLSVPDEIHGRIEQVDQLLISLEPSGAE